MAVLKLTQLEHLLKKNRDQSGGVEHTGKQFSFPYRDRCATAVEDSAMALHRGDGCGEFCINILDGLPENAPILRSIKAVDRFKADCKLPVHASCVVCIFLLIVQPL